MNILYLPIALSETPLRRTFTSDAKWEQSWRQIGWWNTSTYEVRDMDADLSSDGPWTELWILAVDAKA